MIFDSWRKRHTKPVQLAEPRVPDELRVYVIGDIHGRSDLLDRMHKMISEDWVSKPTRDGLIVYVGDYMDRGPDSCGVLERLCNPAPSGLMQRFLMGNHEEILQRFLTDPEEASTWRQIGGFQTLLSYGLDLEAAATSDRFDDLSKQLAEALPDSHKALLESLELSITIGDYFICHAGVRPGIPLEAQRASDLLWIRSEFLNATTQFGKIIVHGHTPVEAPEFLTNRINIDTGAFATGHTIHPPKARP